MRGADCRWLVLPLQRRAPLPLAGAWSRARGRAGEVFRVHRFCVTPSERSLQLACSGAGRATSGALAPGVTRVTPDAALESHRPFGPRRTACVPLAAVYSAYTDFDRRRST